MMNRRDFIYAGAVSVAAMSARSYARVLGANDRVGLGVIGLGRRGRIVAAGFLEDPRAEIRATCDIYDAQRQSFSSALRLNPPGPATFDAYEDLLARKEVDAVLISVPDHLHVTIATAALGAGKHVYLEKPTVHQWNERKVLIDAARRQNLVVQCGMQQRSGAHYARAKQELFESGKLGDVLFARGVWHNFPWQARNIKPEPKPPGLDWKRFLGPAPDVPYETIRYTSWRYFPAYGNGLLADILTHWVDVAQWMMDDAAPRSASALGGIYRLHDGRENPDTVSAVIQYEHWNMNFESSVMPIPNKRPSVFFEGSQGTLDLARNGYTFTPHAGEAQRVDSTESLERAHTKNFLDAVVQSGTVNAPLKAGIEASLPVQMALRSYWGHKVIAGAELA